MLRSGALCGTHTQTVSAAKFAAHARFFPNYPILGIGLTGDHCLFFNCAELPRSKRILEATGYRYPVAFSMGARPLRAAFAQGCRLRGHELAVPSIGQRQRCPERHTTDAPAAPHAACRADLRPGRLQAIHKLRVIGIASKMLAHCVSRQPARCRNCIVRRGMVLEPRIVQPQSASALHIRLYRSFKCRSTLSFPPRCAAACSPWPRWPPCRPSSWRLPVWRSTVTGSMITLPSI